MDYGILGGAVCPKCGKPFRRSLMGLNLVLWRFQRCPHCRKWILTRRASRAELEQAEKRMASVEQPAAGEPLSPEERLRRQIEASKYEEKR